MKIMIENARLAFPNVFVARAQVGADGKLGKPKFGASLIIPPGHPAIAMIEAAYPAIAKEKWGDKAPAILAGLKKQDKLALHDGDTKTQYAGFEGNMFVSANNEKRPAVFDRERTPITEADGKIYAGCYVNASIGLWAMDNKYGKRINAELRGIQFVRDGDAFGAGTTASEDEFADLGDQGADTDPTA